ncbi:class I SAM-dependent methyltransferase [Gordonia sp. X0973]|uniref:class I SAM-dependent methyltransferase n=1 Tax=Gordonia sp. X0973 TaxID=2742602 RepID=UPI000F5485EC|nr:class I SAM-dependent methyltransferase [Gordonia sp. X0973]QKT06040.1 class I SAM-dependent methyltransferase [Gordonia sp. X0973]
MTRTIDGNSLRGVSATTLWTLRNRAEEAKRPAPIIDDPLAVELYETIDYDYEKFGKPSQSHALRALAADAAARDHLARHPGASVVNLGEGLQTSFWRVADPKVAWISVDLAPVMEVRRELLPREEQIVECPTSALDRAWFDEVPDDQPVLIIAEGLFMYFEPDEVWALLTDLAARFPGGSLFFDSIPSWFSKKTVSPNGLHLTDRYRTPPMPFSLNIVGAAAIPKRIPAITRVDDVPMPRGRGPWGNALLMSFADAPVLKNLRPSISLAHFAE